MESFPYYSHTAPIRIPKDMGIVWESYHKGVPSLGVPENILETNHLPGRMILQVTSLFNFWRDDQFFHVDFISTRVCDECPGPQSDV